MERNDISWIGMRQTWGGEQPFGIHLADRRHHLYVVGKTGTGKTTLLRNLIIQDLEAGRGVGLIDPHGDLASDILHHIPRRRTDDLVYFDPADIDHPVGLNLLHCRSGVPKHLIASGVVGAFKSIWRESWGPRLEYILYAAVASLLECENVSLLGLQRVLCNPRYRRWVVRQVRDPILRSFWEDEFERYDKRFQREAIAPIQNKVGQLLMAPVVRNVLGQISPKVDFRFMMDNRRIFIANLSKGALGDDKSALLGSLIISQFQLAALSRATMETSKRSDFLLYIDEFQNFTTDSFISILSEARKFGLCLTLSHQYVDQVPANIRDAVFGNVGSIICFRVGSSDAAILEREFGGVFPGSDFSELDNRHIRVRLLSEGHQLDPFSATTLSPIHSAHTHKIQMIRRSREKYGAAGARVEGKISRWLQN